MKEYKWQKLVAEDDYSKIKCLCGRQAGASTLVPMISIRNNKVAVFHKYGPSREYMNQSVKALKNYSVQIVNMYGQMNSTLEYIIDDKLKIIDFLKYYDSPGYQIKKGKSMDYDVIVFDNIEPESAYQLEDFINQVKKYNPKVQIYILVIPFDTEYKWYVIPSINNPNLNEDYYYKMKDYMQPERYHQEILAGLILPDEIVNGTILKFDDIEEFQNKKILKQIEKELNEVLDKYVGEPVTNEVTYQMAKDTKIFLKKIFEEYGSVVIKDDAFNKKLTDINFLKSSINPNSVKVEFTWEPLFESEGEDNEKE
ncbi:MAG: hypothetical protein ACOCRO_04480 [Halanaerobiales bacterium]